MPIVILFLSYTTIQLECIWIGELTFIIKFHWYLFFSLWPPVFFNFLQYDSYCLSVTVTS